MSVKEGIAGVGVAIVGVVGLGALSYGALHWQGFLGKAAEEIRYDIHKESQAYRDGMQRTLSQLQQDYASADAAGKQAIMLTVRHQFSQVDTSEYPAYLRDFLITAGVY